MATADVTSGTQGVKSGFSKSMGCVFGLFAGLLVISCVTFGGCLLMAGGCTMGVSKAVDAAREAAREVKAQQAVEEQQLSEMSTADLPVLSSKYFGFQLGDTIDLRQMPGYALWPYDSPTGAETVIRRCSGIVTISGDFGEKKHDVNLECFDGKLCELTVWFDDASTTAYETMVDELTKKYGEPKSSLFTTATFKTTDNGQDVEIHLKNNFSKMYIVYRYIKLKKLAEVKAKKKLAAGIGSQI